MFKSQVQHSYSQLLHVQVQNGSTKLLLSKEPKLKIQQVVNINYPETIVKEESDDDIPIDKLKREAIDEMHCEPETFVRDLNLPHTKKESSKKYILCLPYMCILSVLHKGENRYPCPRCGKVYQWKSNLGRHMRSHKSGKKFVSKTRLRDHIDWEHLHNIKFRCHLCNKAYKCHTSLYVHLQNVHRDKEARHNLCHVCGKSYQNAAKLKYHIVAMHTSETPYRCERCGAAFGWYSSLYRHVREVHYKMKVQPKKTKKGKKNDMTPLILPQQAMPT
ncbi:Zinc finger protein 555 [Papilio xuthus]|uniref:Zinc finger protein 555 n=1 Tax=Papilio xuthus TaxID=66420 RepID=A0A194Q3P5_PAPXU|nr:Zinc finger protein 555 [Papilio xuthus]